jgi:hypothetical protein
LSDHLNVDLARRGQSALGLAPLRRRAGEPGLGLRDHGLRQLTLGEAASRRPDLALQDPLVGGGEFQDLSGAHDVDVGGRCTQQSVLLGPEQLSPLGANEILRLLDSRRRAAPIDRLDDPDVGGSHRSGRRLSAAPDGFDRRPPVGQGLRHLFVDLT